MGGLAALTTFPRGTPERLDRDDLLACLTEADVQTIYERLGVTEFRPGGLGHWSVCSPLRDDESPSFSVRRLDGVWKDHGTGEAGSLFDAIMRKEGCSFPEALEFVAGIVGLPRETARQNGRTPTPDRVVATYDYRDADGTLLYQVVRFEPKDFRQRRPDGAGGWRWSLEGVQRVPYRLPELLAADKGHLVWVVEGEKDVDRLAALGLVATTNARGAGQWSAPLSAYLAGCRVVILPDNDVRGRRHAQQVAASLHGVAAEVRIVTLSGVPEKGDVSDWLDAGGTVADLRRLAAQAPLWTPAEGPSLIIKPFTAIETRPIDWLWKSWLARRKTTLLAGVEGDGKTTVAACVAATLAAGGTWPDGTPAPPGRVLFLVAEDGLDDTIRPKLERHGADLSRVFFVQAVAEPGKGERLFNLAQHLPLLEQSITAYEIDLVIIDPLSSFMPGSNRNDEGEVRDLLTPLTHLADRTNVAVLGIVHIGKPNGTARRASQRLLGSTAFAAIARQVWMVVPVSTAQQETRRLLAVVKSNLALKPPALEWELPGEDLPVTWHGSTERSIDEVLNGSGTPASGPSPERLEIIALIRGKGQSMTAKEVAAALDKKEATVRYLLSSMEKDGQLVKVNWGTYALPPSQPTHSTHNSQSSQPSQSSDDDGPIVSVVSAVSAVSCEDDRETADPEVF